MTYYLWHSQQQEEILDDTDKEDARRRGFNSRARGIPFSIHLDSFGDPVKATQVTQTPDHDTLFTDMKLIDTVEKDICLVSRSGLIDDEAREYCAQRDIQPTISAIVWHMYDIQGNSPFMRSPVTVKPPIRLK